MRKQMNAFRKLMMVVMAISIWSSVAIAQTDSLSLFESLYGDSILEMHITTNLRQIIKKKAKKEKHRAVLTYQDANGVERQWNIKIRARGNMRNKICFLPPLKLNFKKDELRAAGIRGQYDDLKLVVHCKNSSTYDNYVLREYLAYKLYNELTGNSFRVQLIKLTLEDAEKKQKNIETYAFLIEDVDELAERVNGRLVNAKFFNHKNLHPASYDMMCIFQFMIGNLDWHILSNHNIKLVTNNSLKSVVAVPYDFDYAAIVNTPYAFPNEKLPVQNIQERFFLGLCRDQGQYEPTLQLFRDKKEQLLSVCKDFSYLEQKTKQPLLDYVEDFFEILEKPKSCDRMIVNHCNRFIKVNLK